MSADPPPATPFGASLAASADGEPAEEVPAEHVVDLVAEQSTTVRVFLGDRVTLRPPAAAADGTEQAAASDVPLFTWARDGTALPPVVGAVAGASLPSAPLPSLVIEAVAPDDFATYTVTWGPADSAMATCTLMRNLSPSKRCPSCGRRNHARSGKCCFCDAALPQKGRPPKRRASRLTMKNYEDAIFEKVGGRPPQCGSGRRQGRGRCCRQTLGSSRPTAQRRLVMTG